MAPKPTITVAHGNGIGPEIMKATLRILEAAGARFDIETIEIGESVYQRGFTSGIEPSAWDSLRRTKVFLKAPITTPQGGGFKSLNVTIRKTLGLYANVRPSVSYHPFVATKHPRMDVVIIRENEEDLYAGIEHRETDQVVQCLKLITRPGCEKIVRYAFEYARRNNRKKVTCFTKDNIMKLTDGLFHKVFDEIGAEYPELQKEHWIVDIGAARLADTPEIFDVIVMPNLYGDILSDVAAQLTELIAEGKEAFLGAGLFFVAASTPDGRIELKLSDGVQQGDALKGVAAAVRIRALLGAADADGVFHTADDQFRTQMLNPLVAVRDRLREVVARIDMQQRERDLARVKRLAGKVADDHRVLACGKQQHRAFKFRSNFAQNEDRFRFQHAKVSAVHCPCPSEKPGSPSKV